MKQQQNFLNNFFLEKFYFTQTWRYNTKLHDPRRKREFLFWVELTLEWYEGVALKLPDDSYVESSFSTITRHIDSSIWETLKMSWKWFNIRWDRSWINTCKTCIQQNSSLVKHHEMKIDKGTWKTISGTKIKDCMSESIATK